MRLSHCLIAPLLLDAVSAATVPDFSREVLPILSENCFHCHGQDAKARKADLRLDVEAEAKKPIDGKPPVLAGNSSKSEIIARLLSHDTDEQMPPPKSNRKVTPAQIEVVRQWIDAGAKWGQHWAYTKVVRPALPPVQSFPGRPQSTNPIDAFIRAKLAEKGMKPSPPATPETLIRRLSLDLTGLPPTAGEVAQFVAQMRQTMRLSDKETVRPEVSASSPMPSSSALPVSLSESLKVSPSSHSQALHSLIDRLLASPRYGERWVWEWLDASRYADSNGYQGDNDRTAWPWRDWVIHAINSNMPYDQFTVWQIAGDLLPQATTEQRLATAFVRNHMINGEGGRIPEENRIEYLFDQAETVGTIWLGLTMQCCRCHDHKFDPLLQTDYYGLVAFFNSTPVDGQGRGGQTAPVLDMSTPAEDQKVKDTQAKVERVAKEVEAFELKKYPRPAGKPLSESEAIKLPGNLPATLAKTEPVKRGVDALLEAKSYFDGAGKDPAYANVLGTLLAAVRERSSAASRVTKVMVMEERKEGPRDTFVLVRGAYDALTTTKVSASTPAMLPAMPATSPKNRLGLAQWLVSRDNPLTARVTVNRYWQSLFGTGLVKTAEDFGVQGERPLHMDLLDYLAADFMASGWDVKRLIRLIVTSETYQQSSKIIANELDPENRLLAHGPRFRLPSFLLRDQALAISGLLAPQQGGPSVRPYQPEGIWEEASFGKITYKPGTGADLYRRSLYTFWRRIVGPTMVFDNAVRQTCVVKSARTNTPLHALTTLNEPTFVEAARAMAQRALTDKTHSDDFARLTAIFRSATARPPSVRELQTLLLTLENLRAQFSQDAAGATKLLHIGDSVPAPSLDASEHAAWTSLCLMILNLDEVLTKE